MIWLAVLLAALAGTGAGWFVGRRTYHPGAAPTPVAPVEDRSAEHAEALAAAEARADTAAAGRDLLAQVVDGLGDGVIVVDAGGGEVMRNQAASRFEDARHEDALVDRAMRELLGRARRGEAVSRELALFGPPRRVLHLEAVPLRHATSVIGAAVLARDVTEVHRIENVRRDFVANVSHELKTPIGALALLAETMASDTDPEVMVQLAERVVREADRLGAMVDDLLDLSLIEAQEAPTREPVPVAVLVGESVDRVASAARAKGITLHHDAPPAAWSVDCDHRQMVSAVTNLLDNAIKYSDPGATVHVGAVRTGDRAAVEVRDHGIGIPSRDLERIFERFYRVDRARSRATGGTGLGLSIVRHVARSHGGDVTVESREGEGSTFRLWLPLAATFTRDAVPPVRREAS